MRSIEAAWTGMHQNGREGPHKHLPALSHSVSRGNEYFAQRRNITEASNPKSTHGDPCLQMAHSLVRCARTPRPNLLAAIADGLPILLVDRTRRQLSRPPQHRRRRRGARGARATLSSLFLTIVWLCSARRCCSNTAPPSPSCLQQLSLQP